MTNIDGEPQMSESALGVDVVAAVIWVSDLDESVNFFCEVFSCRVVVRHSNTALLLAPKGFEIYLHQKDEVRSRPHRQGLGVRFLMWAADSPDDLERIAGRLRARASAVYTYVEDGMAIVEGTAPDGFRMIVAYPPPRELPRTTIARRIRS